MRVVRTFSDAQRLWLDRCSRSFPRGDRRRVVTDTGIIATEEHERRWHGVRCLGCAAGTLDIGLVTCSGGGRREAVGGDAFCGGGGRATPPCGIGPEQTKGIDIDYCLRELKSAENPH